MGEFGNDPVAFRYFLYDLKVRMLCLCLTFPSPYATLFYRSKRSEYIFKSNDEESSLPEILQRNPRGIHSRTGCADAERDRMERR